MAATVVAVSAGLFGGSPRGHAQDAGPAEVIADAPKAEAPSEAVALDVGVSEVEKAIEQVEEDTEAALPAELTIEFGDTKDWLRLTSGECLKGEIHWMREGEAGVIYYYSRRLFFSPASVQLLNDRFQNLKLRATPGVGAGVHVYDTKKVTWDVGGALGYQHIRFQSTAAGLENPRRERTARPRRAMTTS